MVKNHRLARNIPDSGWGAFGTMDYKRMRIEVPARNTTMQCSRCGGMVPNPWQLTLKLIDLVRAVF